ncbi:YadA-like family protein [Rodentibacter genomosp. 2]|uniref:Adhesin n=1 Tax=Rodentibacter genomosp. 2 TaxID=1908266 RepID=A0A1V3JM70_9PAST|nr:YadA-like family protein [Rodentibacter genomosp. 2]OOF57519.1 hypothetical protein BKK55_04470 [Rodentibacter genomosp. 2]
MNIFRLISSNLFNQQAIKSAQELTNDASKLKLYDVRNEVIKGVIEAAQNLKNDVENAQQAVNAKQDEIDDIRRQITELGLTDDEQRAADLKQQKHQELMDKQSEKSSLEEEYSRKQKELDDILRRFANTGLANLGRHSVAHGVQAFASGEDSIAIGTDATAQHIQAVAIGKGNLVTAQKGIALGSQNTISGANAIAIGAHNRVAGANTVILGHNIDTTVENSVGLGANTTLANPIATTGVTIGQQAYYYAGTSPVGTVSVGALNAERTITNVAAGRVSRTSTDAINGSQLYALQDYINHLQLPKTDNPTTIIPATDINIIAGQNIESVEKTTDQSGAVSYTINAVGYSGGEGVQINEQQEKRIINVSGVRTGTDDGQVHQHTHLNKTLEIQGDGKNLSTRTTSTGAIQTVLNNDLGINSLTIENGGPSLSKDGINANHTIIQNIAEGVKPTDAVNVRQLQKQGDKLHQRIDNVEQRIHKNHKRTSAGIASVAAMSNIPQVMLAGRSGIGVGVGHRGGQTAVSVGYSRASDNAKHIVKLSAGVDTQHKTTFGAGYMYQW